ncbi:MAG: D-glycerate dehydrogenase [Candidatus Niyogibacteria bacterium]|nr:D-glycerate dehydrogenase [Candidatus Niyogibacteria bacterium]
MPKIFVTRRIPEAGIRKLEEKGHEVVVSPEDRVLQKKELIEALAGQNYDAVLCLLTDTIDGDVLDAAGKQCKIFANVAVGFDNIDLVAAAERNVMITNTPGVLTNTVAEHTFALMLAAAHRVVEADRFTRAGLYGGWAPMLLLGNDLSGKTVGIVGLGRIGSRVAYHAVKGFDAKVIYYDVARNEQFEQEFGAIYKASVDELLPEADFVSIHVPLLDSTRHLMNAERLRLMKPTAYLVNTSRGPIVDEAALVDALKSGVIRGAALDVFENEPKLASGLAELENVVLTPHIASATEETRSAMSALAADNIIAALEGQTPPNLVKKM